MYLNNEQIQRLLNELSGTEIQKSNLLEVQRLEDLVRFQKIQLSKKIYSSNNRFNLDSFLDLLSHNIGIDKIEIEYYYYIAKQYDYIQSINEKRRAYMTFFGDIHSLNCEHTPCYEAAIVSEIERLLDENADFLFLCSDDDSFIADIVKTPNEIILPYGNSIKYHKGSNNERIERGIRLASDIASSLDFPVTLKLKP